MITSIVLPFNLSSHKENETSRSRVAVCEPREREEECVVSETEIIPIILWNYLYWCSQLPYLIFTCDFCWNLIYCARGKTLIFRIKRFPQMFKNTLLIQLQICLSYNETTIPHNWNQKHMGGCLQSNLFLGKNSGERRKVEEKILSFWRFFLIRY